MSVIFVFMILFKGIIIKLLSQKYAGAAIIVPFLLFNLLMSTISETTTLGIAFSRKTGYNIIISVVSAGVNFIGNSYLVPKYGALGASISTGISYIVFFWMRTLISRKLWVNFKIGFYFFNTLLMLTMSFVNVVYNNTILNMVLEAIVLIYNREIFVYVKRYLVVR